MSPDDTIPLLEDHSKSIQNPDQTNANNKDHDDFSGIESVMMVIIKIESRVVSVFSVQNIVGNN